MPCTAGGAVLRRLADHSIVGQLCSARVATNKAGTVSPPNMLHSLRQQRCGAVALLSCSRQLLRAALAALFCLIVLHRGTAGSWLGRVSLPASSRLLLLCTLQLPQPSDYHWHTLKHNHCTSYTPAFPRLHPRSPPSPQAQPPPLHCRCHGCPARRAPCRRRRQQRRRRRCALCLPWGRRACACRCGLRMQRTPVRFTIRS